VAGLSIELEDGQATCREPGSASAKSFYLGFHMTKHLMGVISLFVVVTLPGSAAAGPVSRFGFLTGATSTSRSFTDTDWNIDTGRAWGWVLGGYVQWAIPLARVSLTTDFMLLEKGYSREIDPINGGLETAYFDNQYLSLPFLITYDLQPGFLTPYVFGGPSVEILKDDPGQNGRTNLAVQVGAGIRWHSLAFDARYAHDLTEATGESPTGPRGVKNRGVTLAIRVGIDATRESSEAERGK